MNSIISEIVDSIVNARQSVIGIPPKEMDR